MSNQLYLTARKKFLDGAISWSGDNIKFVLVDAADYTFSTAHEFLSDVASGGRVATSGNFTGKDSTNGIADADNLTLTSVTGDPCECGVIYKDTGTAGTSPLIAYIDTAAGLPITPIGANITITWDNGTNKIFKL